MGFDFGTAVVDVGVGGGGECKGVGGAKGVEGGGAGGAVGGCEGGEAGEGFFYVSMWSILGASVGWGMFL